MPRMSGLELLGRIGSRYPALVKILLSGYTELADIRRAVSTCGIHNYIIKPIDSRRLLVAIDDAYRVRDGAAVLQPPDQ